MWGIRRLKGKKPSEVESQPQSGSAEKHRSIKYTLKSIPAGDLRKTRLVWQGKPVWVPKTVAVSFIVTGTQNGESMTLGARG